MPEVLEPEGVFVELLVVRDRPSSTSPMEAQIVWSMATRSSTSAMPGSPLAGADTEALKDT